MNDEQMLRYSRQIMLPDIGYEGQQRLLNAHVLVIGLGGLGSPAAMYLAAAGVGELTLVDYDQVDLSNLQRQIIHHTEDLGTDKVLSAKKTVAALNPECRINCINHKLTTDELNLSVSEVDLVIDGSDNFATRFALNEACHNARKPLVSGAAIRMEGQVAVFTAESGQACYQCLYNREGADDETCAANGILAPVVGIIGCVQATEALKLLTQTGEPLIGKLLILDAMQMQWRTMKLKPDPHCPVCSSQR